ncbi:MAG: hypothetical protein NZM07_01870 [Elioraea sp.]|nr:hypothetical protein [Elioraea sp.]
MTPQTIVFGLIGALVALVGLVMMAAAKDDAFYVAGLILFVSFVLYLFKLVRLHFDREEARRR